MARLRFAQGSFWCALGLVVGCSSPGTTPDAPITDTPVAGDAPAQRLTSCPTTAWTSLSATPLFEAGVPDATLASALTEAQALTFCTNWGAAENRRGECGLGSAFDERATCRAELASCLSTTLPVACGIRSRPLTVPECEGLTVGELRAALARRTGFVALYAADFCDVPASGQPACGAFPVDMPQRERDAVTCALGTQLTGTR